MSLLVVNPGPMALLQDLGRSGYASLGVSPSGALDPGAFALGNVLLGNPPGSPALEILLGPASFEFSVSTEFALTGAYGTAALNGNPVPFNRAVSAEAGGVLELGVASVGLRYYLTVQGGFRVPRVLDSAASDTLSGLGPAPVGAGDILAHDLLAHGAAGSHRGPTELPSSSIPLRRPSRHPSNGPHAVRILPGPRLDWFAEDAWVRLLAGPWTVSADSNRVGMRLEGRPLERVRRGELPTEGMVAGALQVPPSGLPTVFLADHPVTGGYPVIAVVHSGDQYVLAQAVPGQRVRFLAGAV